MSLWSQGLENRDLNDRYFALWIHHHHWYENSMIVSSGGIGLERHSLLMETVLEDLPQLGRATHPELQIVGFRRKPRVIIVQRGIVMIEDCPLLLFPMR